MPPEGEALKASRLRWQCRRGMRELDVLLTRYLENDYPRSTAGEKSAFQELLTLSDPELIAYLLQREPCKKPAIEDVLGRIRH